jgi:hypothetical protein
MTCSAWCLFEEKLRGPAPSLKPFLRALDTLVTLHDMDHATCVLLA